jgi:Na+-translocating ferredoxin:NAD+ oxidoreductase subunit G
MKRYLRLILVLLSIGCACAVLFGARSRPVRPHAPVPPTSEILSALPNVLPESDNHPDKAARTISDYGTNWTFFVARRLGKYVGAAFVATSAEGYSGPVKVLVGVQADSTVKAIEIVEHQETTGLGAEIAKPAFTRQFAGRPIDRTTWKVRNDGGDLDAITGATTSSRAAIEAVRNGLDVYRRHVAEIVRTPK